MMRGATCGVAAGCRPTLAKLASMLTVTLSWPRWAPGDMTRPLASGSVLIVLYPILINLRMAYTLQLAFLATFLIYLVALPMCFPLGMVLAYLLKRKGDATITLEEGL